MSDPRPAPAASNPVRRGRALRAKLVSLTLLANMAGFVVAIFVARSMRAGRVEAGSESLWMFGYYAAMFVVALFDAFLIDELLFHGAFRRTYLEGRSEKQIERSGDDMELVASFKGGGVRFPMVVVLSGAVTYFLFNLVNDDFDTYQRTIGNNLADLRSDDPELQRSAVAKLSIQRAKPVLPALTAALKSEGPAAPWAAWALGRFHDLPVKRPVVVPLVAAARSENPEIRREALVALGRLQHRPMAPYIHTEIQAQIDAGETVDPRLLYALGSIQVTSSVPILEGLLHAADEPTQRLAAWALAQHRDQREGRVVVDVLEKRLPSASLDVRCAIVHALGILADERSNAALMRAYDDATPDEWVYVCPRVTMAMRPDGGDDEILLLRPERKFGMKVIMSMGQMRATTKDVRDLVEPWLVALSADQGAPYEVQAGSASLLSGIRGGRNDGNMKSVDEAFGKDEPQ